ncbi:MAG TPA: SdpI family protein [Anaerolineales bacterium]
MSTRTVIVLSAILILIAALVGVLFYPQLPERMASHWNLNNQVDGYISRFWGAFLMPLISLGLLVLFMLIPQIDPLKTNIAQFRGYFNIFILLLIVFMVYLHALTLAWNLGYTGFNMGSALLPALGLFIFFMGFLLEKTKRNWFIGIRTPWTLSSDKVWDETHRLGATLFKISGLLAILGAFLPEIAFWLMFIPLIGSSLFLVVYSYLLYARRERTFN